MIIFLSLSSYLSTNPRSSPPLFLPNFVISLFLPQENERKKRKLKQTLKKRGKVHTKTTWSVL